MKKTAAFSLIEVLVFISILSVFFVVAMVVVTTSLRNMKVSEHKILAARYAEEGIEWIRSEKERIGWDTFTSLDSISGTTYCLNSLEWISGTCTTYALGNPVFFKREVVITNEGSPATIQVNAVVTVKWLETGGVVYQVPIREVYRIWE